MKTKTTTENAKPRKNLAQLLGLAKITETGKDATGRMMANVIFPDGTRGGIDYEVLRKEIVRQGAANKSLLEALGYKVGMVCIAGLHGSATYEKDGMPTLEIDGTHMNRILELGENGAKRDLSVKELLAMYQEVR